MTLRIFSVLLICFLTLQISGNEDPEEKERRTTPTDSIARREPVMSRIEIFNRWLNPDPCTDLKDDSLKSAWIDASQNCGGALMKYNRLPDSEKRCPVGKEPGCRKLNALIDPVPRCTITTRLPVRGNKIERGYVDLLWCLAGTKYDPQPKVAPSPQEGEGSSSQQPEESADDKGKKSLDEQGKKTATRSRRSFWRRQ